MLRRRTLDEMFEFIFSEINEMDISRSNKIKLIGYLAAIEGKVEEVQTAEPTHANPEDTYREDFGKHAIRVGDLDCDDLVYRACKPSNRPVDERNDGEPINVSTNIKHGLKWSCELEDCSFSPNMTRHFDSIESAEKYADGVLTKGIAKGVTIRRLEW